MSVTACYIPRNRLKLIPQDLRLAHEYCYFLHDQCVEMLRQYEGAKAHHIQIKLNKEEKRRFAAASKNDPIEVLKNLGRPNEARRVIMNTITMGMVSDGLHHLYEALQCLEKRKSVVALNLLRKPLMDNLVYLSWMLGDEDGFFCEFSSGNPDLLAQRKLGNRRQEIIDKALSKTQLSGLMDASIILENIFNSQNEYGLYGLFQHAVHLITVDRVHIKTSPENFNFIFKNPFDDDVYGGLYGLLPSLLLYLSHVISELFNRVRPMDEGAKTAFFTRAFLGFNLVDGGWSAEQVLEILDKGLSRHIQCSECAAPLLITEHNAARILLTETFRCTRCRRVHGFPFSWIF